GQLSVEYAENIKEDDTSIHLTSFQLLPAAICFAKHARARAKALASAPTDTGASSSLSLGHEARGSSLNAGRCGSLPTGGPPAKQIAPPSLTHAGRDASGPSIIM